MNATWMLLLTAVLAFGDDPAALVQRLGAPRYADREAAAEALQALGRDALPALRQARKADDLEIRSRAAVLLEQIEVAVLQEPTLVRLDFRDRPAAEIIAALAERSGVPVVLATNPDEALLGRQRITLQADQPVPFWQAIDQLGRLARLRTEVRPIPVQDDLAVGVAFEAPGAELAPTSCQGAFRVKLASLSLRRDRDLDAPAAPRGDPDGATLTGRLLISGEPRLILGQAGDLELTEATDDTGQSLLGEPDGPAFPEPEPPTAMVEFVGSSELNLALAFERPPSPEAETIRRLRGRVAVAVACPSTEHLDAPLADSAGRSVASDGLILLIDGLKPAGQGGRYSLSMRLRAEADYLDALARLGGNAAPPLFEQQVEVFDRDRRPAVVTLMQVEPDVDEIRLQALISMPEGSGPPERLVFHPMTHAVVEVSFDFAEVPLP